ncbi:hypothetical protein C8R45DRAFT_926689 [Mycena sanguinolenta]|nr:hypothetical protein C8R45DRAFT_926689 [Mycena sanguinolenta]
MSTPEPTLFGLHNSETPALELFLEDPERFMFDVTVISSLLVTSWTTLNAHPFLSALLKSTLSCLWTTNLIRLLPFLRMPARISFTSLEYLADLLDSALPAFRAFAETIDQVPCTAVQGCLVRALVEVALHLQDELPSRFSDAWLSVAGRRGAKYWVTNFGMVPHTFRFPGVIEFSADHPQMTFPLTPQEHQFFLAYANQAVLDLTSIICDPSTTRPESDIIGTLDRCCTFFNRLRNATTSKAINGYMIHAFTNSIHAVIGVLPLTRCKHEWVSALPAIPDSDMILLPPSFVFPMTPHWTEASEPFPLFDSGRLPDPLWLAWEEFGRVRDAVMLTPRSPTPRPASSHANSAPPLDLTAINESPDEQVQDPPADIILSPAADPVQAAPSPPAVNPTPPADIVDSIEAVPSSMTDTMPPQEKEAPQSPEPVEDTPFLSLDTPAPAKFRRVNKRDRASSPTRRRTTSPPLKKPKVSKRHEVSPVRDSTPGPSTRVLRRSTRNARQATAPPFKKTSPAPAKRPVIKTRAPRKSTTPSNEYIPPVEALDEGESEVEDEGNPQADTQRGHRIRVDGLPVCGLGKESQPFVDNGTCTQLPVEALGFTLRDYQHVKRRMNHARCTNCVARGVKCTHQGPGLKCAECKCQSRSGCSHLLSHGNFLNIAEDLFPLTRYAPSAELDHIVVDFTRSYEDLLLQEIVYTRTQHRFALTAHVLGDWMQGVLASYGPQALPGMDLVPESLRGIWHTMLDKCTLALQNEMEPELPMVDVPIGTVPETDSRDFLTFLRDLDDRVQADNAATEQHPEPERQVKQESADEEEDGEIIEEN